MNSTSSFNFGEMLRQSVVVLSRPSVQSFERYERGGTSREAFSYVLIAAVVSAVIAAIFAPFHREVTFFGQLITRLILVPLSFGVFTGAVYYIGRSFFGGSGTYPEVAYTFALFFVPLSIVSSIIGIIPILGWLVSFIITILMIYFGWLAVQSSMNIRDGGKAAIALIISGIAYFLVQTLIASLILAPFVLGR